MWRLWSTFGVFLWFLFDLVVTARPLPYRTNGSSLQRVKDPRQRYLPGEEEGEENDGEPGGSQDDVEMQEQAQNYAQAAADQEEEVEDVEMEEQAQNYVQASGEQEEAEEVEQEPAAATADDDIFSTYYDGTANWVQEAETTAPRDAAEPEATDPPSSSATEPPNTVSTSPYDDDFSAYYSAPSSSHKSYSSWGWFGTRAPATASPTTLSPTPSPTTASPTVSPTTASPTASPTSSCRDNPNYRDPITYTYPCEYFSNQECLLTPFTYGFSADQLYDLLDNCPVSCAANSEEACADDAASAFQIETSFAMIRGVYLGEDSVAALETATAEYASRYLRSRGVRAVVLTSSVLAEEKQVVSKDTTATSTSTLQLSLSLEGVAYGIEQDDVYMYINQGLLNNAYSRALKFTGDSVFSNVYISFQETGGGGGTTTRQEGKQRRGSNSSRKKKNKNGGEEPPETILPLGPAIALSSALLMAATGYTLQVMVSTGLLDTPGTRRRKQENQLEIVDVTEFGSSVSSSTTDEHYHSFGDHAVRTTPSVCGEQRRAPRHSPYPIMSHTMELPNQTFDSYEYSTRTPIQRQDSLPEVTFVDSGLFESLQYKHITDEEQPGVTPSESNVSESLHSFVQRLDGNLDTAVRDFNRGFR